MVVQSRKFAWSEGKYLVYFTSPNCGYCQSFSATWDKAVEELKTSAPHIKTLKVNAEEFDIASVSPEVYGYPTVRAFSNGDMVNDFDQDRTKDRYTVQLNGGGESFKLKLANVRAEGTGGASGEGKGMKRKGKKGRKGYK